MYVYVSADLFRASSAIVSKTNRPKSNLPTKLPISTYRPIYQLSNLPIYQLTNQPPYAWQDSQAYHTSQPTN